MPPILFESQLVLYERRASISVDPTPSQCTIGFNLEANDNRKRTRRILPDLTELRPPEDKISGLVR